MTTKYKVVSTTSLGNRFTEMIVENAYSVVFDKESDKTIIIDDVIKINANMGTFFVSIVPKNPVDKLSIKMLDTKYFYNGITLEKGEVYTVHSEKFSSYLLDVDVFLNKKFENVDFIIV